MLGANILVELVPEEKGEIIKFNTGEQELTTGVVKEVNPRIRSCFFSNFFKFIRETRISIGQKVMFPTYSGHSLQEGKTKLKIIKESDVILIVL